VQTAKYLQYVYFHAALLGGEMLERIAPL
jgi:hypothetical protein